MSSPAVRHTQCSPTVPLSTADHLQVQVVLLYLRDKEVSERNSMSINVSSAGKEVKEKR